MQSIPTIPENQGFKEFQNKYNLKLRTLFIKFFSIFFLISVNDIVPIQQVQLQQSTITPLAFNYDEKFFHDEDDSMAEYGNGENVQFDEDGSFIGLYNKDRIHALNYNNFASNQPIFEKQSYNLV